MANATRDASVTNTCGTDGCDKPLRARGLCVSHYNREHGSRKYVQVACPICGEVTRKRDDGSSTRTFCSLVCRDVWRIDQPSDPMYTPRGPVRCQLPSNHPVIVAIRQRRRLASLSPHRRCFEANDWPGLMGALEAQTVKVDECWLWSGGMDGKGYGKVAIANKHWSTHRLMAHAMTGGLLSPMMAVHHTCAEPWCIAPHHLQIIEPHLNMAEMVERNAYQRRISELEAALHQVNPSHPLVRTLRIA